ncbi:MAG: phospholipid carrier-dependent glycosyltransferase [Candidatus Sericytochromatia bacterium]|nr:phospholipid carrier-dependent glycosyltransferase [Candidatus Sericytochromatia bacterium]
MQTTAQPVATAPTDKRSGFSTETKTILYVLGAALLLRIILAMVFPGHPTDINNFKAWAMHWVKVGPQNFFTGPMKTWCDYPPAYVYVLGSFAWVYNLLDPGLSSWGTPFFTLAVKLPALLAELGCGWMIFRIARRYTTFGLSLAGMTLYLFNPATNYDTALAGQMNPVIGLIQLVILWCLIGRRHAESIVLTALAILVKPQGLILGPLIALVALCRKDFKGIALGSVGGFLLAFLLTAPYVVLHLGWGQVFPWLYGHYQEQLGLYPYSSIQAFNLWSLTGMWQPDNRILLGLPHQTWGTGLFAAAYVAILAMWWRRREDGIALIQAAALIMTAFFLLPTRMHERYLHYTLILMMVPAILSVRWRWPVGIFSATFLINVAYELKFPLGVKGFTDWLATGPYKLLAILNLATFAYCLYLAFKAPTLELPEPAIKVAEPVGAPATWKKTWHDILERKGFELLPPLMLVKADWIAVGLLTLVSSATRMYNLAWPPQMMFDEVYHARTANEYLFGIRPTEWVHPPLAKLFILIGVWLNGMTSYGWRIVPVICGSLLLPVFYLLAKNVIGDRRWALVATALLAMDGVYMVQSRTAMTNIFAITFQVATMTAFWLYWKSSSREKPLNHRWLFATGLCLALALATRWTSLWTFGTVWLLLGVRYLLPIIWQEPAVLPAATNLTPAEAVAGSDPESAPTDSEAALRADAGAAAGTPLPTTVGTPLIWAWRLPRFDLLFWAMAIVYLFVLPCVVYALSYIPYQRQGHTWTEILRMQADIWRYHANLRDPHPYYSAWYTWPFLYRPTWYYFKGFADHTVAGVDAIGNPAIWWSSLAAVGWALWTGLKRRKADWLYAVTVFGFMYLPWAVSPRILNYSHYYFEAIPYAILAITLLVKDLWETSFSERMVALGFLVACLGLFIFFYPIWTGMPISNWYFYLHIWFPRWV